MKMIVATYIISELKQPERICFCCHNQVPCEKSTKGATGQAFSYFAWRMHLILKVESSHRMLETQGLATHKKNGNFEPR